MIKGDTIDDAIREESRYLNGGIPFNEDTRVPLYILKDEDLKVYVIPSTSVDKMLDEVDDNSLIGNCFWLFGGIFVDNFASNLFSTNPEWRLTLGLLFLVIIFGLLWLRFNKRQSSTRKKLVERNIERREF